MFPLYSQMSMYDLMGLGWGLNSREAGPRDAVCRGDRETDLQGAWRVQARRGRGWVSQYCLHSWKVLTWEWGVGGE